MATRERYSITGGPNEQGLSVSLFYEIKSMRKHRIPVEFELETVNWPASKHSAIITGAKEKDRTMGIYRLEMLISEITHEGGIDYETTVRAVATYSTKSRDGILVKTGIQPLEDFQKLFKKMSEDGDCEMNIDVLSQRWKSLWCISQLGDGSFRFCDCRFKATLSRNHAFEIIKALGLSMELSDLFKNGKTWRKPL